MQSRFVFAFSFLVVASGVSCAQGSVDFEEGSGGSSEDKAVSSTSVTGSGGTTNTSTSSSSGGSSSSSSAGTGGGSGGSCLEDPCKLIAPQCGCDVDEQCTLDGKLTRACVSAGTIAQARACSASEECAPGLLCVQPGGSDISICEKFCEDDSQCQAPGGLCVLTLNDGMGGTLQDVTLCTDDCDPSSDSSCPAASSGCQIAREDMGQMRFFSLCTGAGAGMQGATCTDNGDCAPSFGCFNTGMSEVCLKYCKVDSPSCPGTAQCVPVQVNMEDVILGNEQYGACL